MATVVEAINAIVLGVAVAAAISLIASPLFRRLLQRRRRRAVEEEEEHKRKPQCGFKRVLADNSYTQFKHLRCDGRLSKEIPSKLHPYGEAITSLLEQPPVVSNFVSGDCHLKMEDSYVWVCTKQQLEYLADLLTKEEAFAVDTEQHSLRSFLGFTTLMQISTGKEDFIIDTIALHDVLDILCPVFADPSICKVFHGADSDVLWLQRDFHIYIVNMFDTAKACAVLSKPQKSLAYLLQTYCGVATNKAMQREDWRMRPLTKEMIQYARTDVHYLLYIAHCLLLELRKESSDVSAFHDNKLNYFFEASRRSNMLCMQLYVKDIEIPPGASSAASMYSRIINLQGGVSQKNGEIRELLWKLCTWRDVMARVHDDSLRFILSDPAIVALAMKVPRNPKSVCACISEADINNDLNNSPSLSSPSPVVINHLDELCSLLEDATENQDDIFKKYLERHFGTTSCCSLAVCSYPLVLGDCSSQREPFFMKQKGGNFMEVHGKKASRKLFIQKFSCKGPVYHNCRIYANDGRLLCFCDRRKLQWYLQKGLAKIKEDDPPAIMLLFEPKGRPEDVDNYFYIQSKKNVCVGCGEKNHYLRYRIIPSCYRMHFLEHLKSHRSHDIVLLCVDCHEVAHSAAEKYKKQMAVEYDIPLFVQKIVDIGGSEVISMSTRTEGETEGSGVSPLQLRTAAMALLRHGSSMPPNRHEELMQIVKSYFRGREVLPEDLEAALLVGMSPNERRRLQKKKGLNLIYHEGSSLYAKSSTIFSECIGKDGDDGHDTQGSLVNDCFGGADCEEREAPAFEIEFIDNDKNISIDMEFTKQEMCGLDDVTESRDNSSSNQFPTSNKVKRLSLLGHGPHGKQVVEHIMSNQGEDGILLFCQRWRQVFVEAVRPRFLPPGWDIMHSGRREFGEFSVYNTSKR